ncbi:MAG: phospho-N-acetylmuramoyl-pentapeptide-transferase [Christensenellaceae bacterium]|jgi:phospho-N-acetylmuramoyl-pentapeptide-transferase|nr:phospho-N-acetylmuramoyl-pentapeptide-transferase [Christensenellaceae bacterium]
MKAALIFGLIAFALAVLIAPLLIKLLVRLKTGQNILKYVDQHEKKGGTPTIGGLIFLLPLFALSPFFLSAETPLGIVAVATTFAYGLLGFLDDYLKIKGHNNLGLRAYQKIIGQVGIALLVSWFYLRANPSGTVFIPFVSGTFDLGAWIFPLSLLALIATTNAVNLTDGLDGLAGSVSVVYLFALSGLILILPNVAEAETLIKICAVLAFAILGFLVFNTNKASIFMGDTGSLAIGGLIAAVSLFSGLVFYILILGIMFVVSAASVIAQVLYFKVSHGKRIFLMSPFHHHLEKKGLTEPKIVFIYSAITALISALTFAILL